MRFEFGIGAVTISPDSGARRADDAVRPLADLHFLSKA
jgi:hypothetical protein